MVDSHVIVVLFLLIACGGLLAILFYQTLRFRRAQENLRLTIEATSDIVLLVDRDATYLDVYASRSGLLAASRENLLGRTAADIVGPELGSRFAEAASKALDTGERQIIRYQLELNGQNHFFDATLEKRDQHVAVATIRDVTTLEEYAAQTATLRERLEFALSSIGIGVWDWDVEKSKIEWDDNMYELFDVDPKTFPMELSNWRDLLHPVDYTRTVADLENAIKGPHGFDTQYRILTREGVRHIRAVAQVKRLPNGGASRMVGLCWDVTREASLTDELDAQRHFMENILNAVTDPIFVKDQHHRWIYGNHAFSVLLDRVPEDYYGKSDFDLFSREIAQQFWDSDEETMRQMAEIEREEKIIAADGGERTILTKKTPFASPDGSKTLVGIIRDITERKIMQKQIEDERARQVAASRLASLGEMAGSIAHEINNPLAIISGYSERMQELLKTEPFSEFKMGEVAKKIETTTNRIATIIKGLRAIARDGGSDHKEKASVASIVQDTLDLCAERIRNQGVEINIKVPKDLSIWCRPVQISQVLLNLLTNAFHAVSAQPAGVAKIEIEASIGDDDMISLKVKDSGDGIPADMRERVFEPFFTTKPVGQGTGLGLSIAASIVREHGGDLVLEDADHTCFNIRLPIGHPDPVAL